MFERAHRKIKDRIESLRAHLANENPLLVGVISSFQDLDKVGYATGLLTTRDTYANRVAWWPMVSILGTFSAGKSTFINHYLGADLQKTGNQAVDDKYTVICFSPNPDSLLLPGLALDADPRFPFYQISEEIEKVAKGEGARVDSYIQLKTCPNEIVRGKIFIDSPGFDADQQRNSTLRITDHIIDLSDLVLVFFDARHPEPGAMRDTLEHLVARTVRRNDASKVLFILNQIDTAAREDNAEEVISAWQRALAHGGLVSGRFYTIYNEKVSVPIENESLRDRYRRKRDADMGEIHDRISRVNGERVYRIIGTLENTANEIEHRVMPGLRDAMRSWRKRTLLLDAVIMLPLLALLLWITIRAGYWQGLTFAPSWLEQVESRGAVVGLLILKLVVLLGVLHLSIRYLVARRMRSKLPVRGIAGNVAAAFKRNTRWWRSIFRRTPIGWNQFTRKRVTEVRDGADRFVQTLNEQFTDPSGVATGQPAGDEQASPQGSGQGDDQPPVQQSTGAAT
ncbi:MAG: dynamin family protein [Gammaproteobacteria bacterium]|jgi:GTPase SAR1 family protein|nr:dynamin family protein [Gammaproteobacteria bacterium]